jgi:polysaccharide biosynthesis protein VpsM
MKSTSRSLCPSRTAIAAAAATLLAGVSASAAPLITIGERAALYFNGSVTARYDDNVYLNANNEESDILFIFSPGVEFTYGGADAIWNFSAYYREDIYRYTDASELNTNGSNVFLNAAYAYNRLVADFDASYRRLTQNAFDFVSQDGVVVERDVYRVALNGEYDLTELFDVGAGISYEETNFKMQQFRDVETIAVPLDLYYNWTPRVDLSLGYRFRDNNTTGTGRDSQDHFINVGARGEVTPNVSGSVRVGYQERNFKQSGLDSRSGFAAMGQAVWDATERMNVSITGSRDLRYSARGHTIESTGGGPRVTYLLTELVTGSAGLYYEDSRYRDSARHDKTFTGDLGVSYAPNEYVDLSAAYIYTNNDSNIQSVDLDRNIFQLTASLRY